MKPARTPSGASFSWRLDGGVGEATLPPLGGSSLLLTITEPASAGSEREGCACSLNENVPPPGRRRNWRSRLGDDCFP